ncbi:MAG: hypothetical protein JKY65_03110 [Planctomycetes bacterium]|nr:hypothetical protein [Planctomycetota bacterium]
MQRIALALGVILTSLGLASAQDDLDPRDLLHAAYELHEGGLPLRRALFAKAWPTTRAYRDLTEKLAAEPAHELIRAYLAGSVGPSLANSQWALDRKELRNKEGDSHDDTRGLMGAEMLMLRYMAGNRSDTEGVAPTLYPLLSVTRAYARSRSEKRLGTWAWRRAKGKATLEGVGLAMLVETRYGIEQLRLTREVQQAGKALTLRGDNATDGFFGLLALQAAGAKAIELQRRLVFDSKKDEILRQESLLKLDPRRYQFPTSWEVSLDGEVLSYSAPETESQLRAQSFVLLAASTLAIELTSKDPAIMSALKPFMVRGQKIYLVDPEARDAAIEVAVFAFRSMLTLHISLASGASAASTASKGSRGMTVSPEDFAVFLQAMEAFSRIPADAKGIDRDAATALALEQGKADKLANALVKNLVGWARSERQGVYDKYDISTNSRAIRNRSLSSQAYAIQGLVAGYKMTGSTAALQAAREMAGKLDRHFWDAKSNAFRPSGRKGTRVREAASLLGALRGIALVTGDGRYIYRYRQYLAHLHEAGWFQTGTSSTPPGFRAEVMLSQK